METEKKNLWTEKNPSGLPSGLRNFQNNQQKDINLDGVWKEGQEHTSCCVHYTTYLSLITVQCGMVVGVILHSY
jgi:hypothetical protein